LKCYVCQAWRFIGTNSQLAPGLLLPNLLSSMPSKALGLDCLRAHPAIPVGAEVHAREAQLDRVWTVGKRGDGELTFEDTGGVSGTWVKESESLR
jgi:hypothetical protein